MPDSDPWIRGPKEDILNIDEPVRIPKGVIPKYKMGPMPLTEAGKKRQKEIEEEDLIWRIREETRRVMGSEEKEKREADIQRKRQESRYRLELEEEKKAVIQRNEVESICKKMEKF